MTIPVVLAFLAAQEPVIQGVQLTGVEWGAAIHAGSDD